ncbi:D-2-hydroxyacid dehydrogenase [Halalkalicoccus ordinarius]|uniref:D-2-hydroxyacid dehydrogenase n=1 Tax=Halalkalicoccus ordinarius TaxID=3116651 RepID=UPI00300EC5AE
MELSRLGIHDSVAAVFPPERLREALETEAPEVVVVGDDPEAITACDAVVTFAHREAFVGLEWVHSIQAGYDRFPLEEFEAAGTRLTNSTGIHGESVGETAVGYMLMLARRLHQYVRQGTEKRWKRPAWDVPFTLDGESLCVVGLGTLGRGIAERAGALDVSVTGVRRSGEPVEGVERVAPSDELHEAIGDARFVAVATPLTDETEGLIGRDEFEAMREDAYLINVARGPIVDERALIDAIETEEIRGAALDVFEDEPLPEDSPLWEFEEVIVTPHAAAYTRDYYRDIAALVEGNVSRIAAGEELRNRVV